MTLQTNITKVLENLKIAQLNDMQLAALKTIESEANTTVLAPTGSGKTLGFLLPIFNMLKSDQAGIQALVLAPSRELALQIEQVFKSMGTGFKVNCCYGGHDMQIERNNLSQPPALLVGTPGRIADHIRSGLIDTLTIKTIVVDEYDKCLDFGFSGEMGYIADKLRNITKRILTSATQGIDIDASIGGSHPKVINFLTKEAPSNLKVRIVLTADDERLDILFRLICKIGDASVIVFCNQRETVEDISALLWSKELPNNVFHGGLDQALRERTLLKFRNGSHRILVTSDLASRGLDIPDIEHVIHYNVPHTETIFTHRNGRTARMHASGVAYLIIGGRETVPPFLDKVEYEKLPAETVLPPITPWETLYIGAGKKEKISKGDIAGLLMQKGQLAKDEVGLIDVLDHNAYVAIKRDKVNEVLRLIRNAPIKKQKVKIEVAK